jgi:hypothetical protein
MSFQQIVSRSSVKKQEIKQTIGMVPFLYPMRGNARQLAAVPVLNCCAVAVAAQLESSASTAAAACAGLLVDDLNEEVKQVWLVHACFALSQ